MQTNLYPLTYACRVCTAVNRTCLRCHLALRKASGTLAPTTANAATVYGKGAYRG